MGSAIGVDPTVWGSAARADIARAVTLEPAYQTDHEARISELRDEIVRLRSMVEYRCFLARLDGITVSALAEWSGISRATLYRRGLVSA